MGLNEQGRTLRGALPLLLAATCSVEVEDIPLDLHQVKTSFLFNLLRFIEWPDDAAYGKGRLNLGIYGAYSLRAFQALNGARAGDRTISVRRLKDLAAARLKKRHVLVVSGDVPVLSVPIARGLLTVGETEGFIACGGIINLFLIDGRVRFQINEDVAHACGFRIDSRLLRLGMR